MVCDVCSDDIAPENSYFLTTSEVLLNINYWRRMRQTMDGVMGGLGFSVSGEALAQIVPGMAAQTHAWAVCEDCADYYDFDRAEARKWALRREDPPGSGAVSAAKVQRVAARASAEPPGTAPAPVRRAPAPPRVTGAPGAPSADRPTPRTPWYRRIFG